ncbi:MAG: carbamoyl-phosphate synthase large subunit, partial [Candidatus Eisenbacteria bacterium]|nr:carbamoyl-phosphate synthase large subunit [Candidatus Eisenbacteria bacterium]
MPRDNSIRSILVLGSGPIVIGQACEFDYSGAQAVKALAAEGYRVILINSNPATIMTDPDLFATARGTAGAELRHATYVEPLTVESLAQILEVEKPDAVLPTVGGQTAINLTLDAAAAGLWKKHGVRVLGANLDALRLAEDRLQFKEAMTAIGLDVPRSGLATTLEEAQAIAHDVGFPLVVRASFTLGGMGSGLIRTPAEFESTVRRGLDLSPVGQVLVEESVLGWHEFELEVMRDHRDQTVVICSIENFDPMGVHTGDSLTVAPAQTLTDREYQKMRDQAFQVIRRVGVDTGGSNIQFAVDPQTRRMVVIEMNPRVSRSSALASKATGFPIAKIAARLAVGYSLDEIANDITRKTPACFEPALDYVVVKIPRWNFEKFPGARTELGTQMRSVGEVMAIGRTFQEALQKGMRSLEMSTSRSAEQIRAEIHALSDQELRERLARPRPDRMHTLREALRRGLESARQRQSGGTATATAAFTPEDVSELTGVSEWFLDRLAEIVRHEIEWKGKKIADLSAEDWRSLKQLGFS